jgi:hypothetical protein
MQNQQNPSPIVIVTVNKERFENNLSEKRWFHLLVQNRITINIGKTFV